MKHELFVQNDDSALSKTNNSSVASKRGHTPLGVGLGGRINTLCRKLKLCLKHKFRPKYD